MELIEPSNLTIPPKKMLDKAMTNKIWHNIKFLYII
jgi:hypothetical protein